MTMESQVKVAIADDHNKVRAGVRRILEQMPEFKVVGEAENGQGAVEMVEQLAPDVLILDIQMPILDGLEVIEILTERGVDVDILVMSAIEDRVYQEEMLRMGICYYVPKSNVDQLIRAIKEIARGKCKKKNRNK